MSSPQQRRRAWQVSRRVAVPVGVAAVAAGAIGYIPSAFADGGSSPSLPTVTAAQLLAKVAASDTQSFSGTVDVSTDLGIPALPSPAGSVNPHQLISGSHTLHVAVDGPDRQRVGIMADLAEYDIIHNGNDVWTYDSSDHSVTHTTKGDHAPAADASLPMTPQQAATDALAFAGTTTDVAVSGTESVAGRSAYDLKLTPKTAGSLIGDVTIAVDSKTGLPLHVVVDTAAGGAPAFDASFSDISFTKPAASTFDFTPPRGATVTQGDPGGSSPRTHHGTTADGPSILPTAGLGGTKPKLIGSGWTTVVELTVPKAPAPTTGTPTNPTTPATPNGKHGPRTRDGMGAAGMFGLLGQVGQKVPGGTVFSTRVLTVYLTDDGRAFAGAVDATTLEHIAATDPAPSTTQGAAAG